MNLLTSDELRAYYNLIIGSPDQKSISSALKHFRMGQPGWAYFGMSLNKSGVIKVETCPELIEGSVPITMVNPLNWAFYSTPNETPVGAIDWIPDSIEYLWAYCIELARKIDIVESSGCYQQEDNWIAEFKFIDNSSITINGSSNRCVILTTLRKLIDYHYYLNMPSLSDFAGDKVELAQKNLGHETRHYVVLDYYEANHLLNMDKFINYFDLNTGKLHLMEGIFYIDNKKNAPRNRLNQKIVGTGKT